jgi:hypothetical protein
MINILPPSWTDLVAVIISIAAIILSTNATLKTTKLDISTKLSAIKDKIRPARIIMQDIFHKWRESYSKNKISTEEIQDFADKNSFFDFYNGRYHNQPSDDSRRLMTNEIFTYLDELHHLWDRYLNKEFTEKQILTWFGSSLKMDANLLLLFLEAHWKEHNQLTLEQGKRFWKNVPIIVAKAKDWTD